MASVSHLPAETSAKSFDEVEQAWDRATARAEAQRCLRCYVIAPPDDKVLKDADCQFCGACVDACPTGALVARSRKWGEAIADREVLTTCPYCGVGCQLELQIKNDRIIEVLPDMENEVNRGQACVKGRFGIQEFVHHAERLTSPLVKRDGKFVETTWDEALEIVASKLAGYKANELGVIASARATNEDNYVFQKLARAVLGTNNIDHCARL